MDSGSPVIKLNAVFDTITFYSFKNKIGKNPYNKRLSRLVTGQESLGLYHEFVLLQ